MTNYYAEFTALTPERLNRLREAFRDVIDDLDQLETQEAAGCESAHLYRRGPYSAFTRPRFRKS
jgi:hypothetical protein